MDAAAMSLYQALGDVQAQSCATKLASSAHVTLQHSHLLSPDLHESMLLTHQYLWEGMHCFTVCITALQCIKGISTPSMTLRMPATAHATKQRHEQDSRGMCADTHLQLS